jgi:hypothetical protein
MEALKKALKRIDANFVSSTGKILDKAVSPEQSYTLYGKSGVKGIGIKLKGWQYPAVIQKGTISYDNFNNRWGDISELHKLQQAYSVESTLAKAHSCGKFVDIRETQKEDGCIELLCTAY